MANVLKYYITCSYSNVSGVISFLKVLNFNLFILELISDVITHHPAYIIFNISIGSLK